LTEKVRAVALGENLPHLPDPGFRLTIGIVKSNTAGKTGGLFL
jgi:hypothetical protein